MNTAFAYAFAYIIKQTPYAFVAEDNPLYVFTLCLNDAINVISQNYQGSAVAPTER